MLFSLFLQITLFHGLLVYAQSSLKLSYIPLAVKTPYLHGWIGNTESSPGRAWPNFFTADREFGWNGLIRVDNQPYQWLGNAPGFNFTKTVTSEITPTKSIFRIEAGPIQFNVTFLSPIEPSNYTLQSIPFSYMYIDGIASNDPLSHTIQVYSDVSAQWVTRDDLSPVQWDTVDSGSVIYHNIARQSPRSMVDDRDMAEDGVGYYATVKRSGLTWQTAADVDCRSGFANNGSLTNLKNNTFRVVNDAWPVFCFSVDLGTVASGSQPDPVVWTLGLVRNPLVAYTTNDSVQNRTGYYWSAYKTIDEVISAFLSDFPNARTRNQAMDDQILTAASAISPEYAGMISLVTRQLFASMDITIPATQSRQPDPSDVRIFMKDIAMYSPSDPLHQRTNPVEVIYGALPALLYFNASFARDLLLPLLEFQSSHNKPYATPDLGASYPYVFGNTKDNQSLAIESSGSMLIMTYAHAVKSGDGSLLSTYYSTLQRWADFLVQNSLHPVGAITADGLQNPEMSNLALKGILGIYSMAKINEVVNPSNTTFMDQAMALIKTWKQLAVTESHIQGIYNRTDSWGLMYNLFPAIWLKTSLIEDDLLNRQAQFYAQQTISDFGYGLDSIAQPDTVYPHWSLLTAATIPAGLNTIRDRFIRSVYQRTYDVTKKFPLPITYKASTGEATTGVTGNAIHGAAFGILALSQPNVNIKADTLGNSSGSTIPKKKTNVGAIVGGVIGGSAFLLIVAGAILFFWRKRKLEKQEPTGTVDEEYSKPHPFTGAPGEYTRVNYNDSATQLPRDLIVTHWSPDGEGASQSRLGSETESSPISPPPGAMPPLPLSSKQREALGQYQTTRTHRSAPSESAVSSFSNPNTTSGVAASEELRAEVEQLRREMETIRNMAEPPPGYQ